MRRTTGAIGFGSVKAVGATPLAAGVGERMFSAAIAPTRRFGAAKIGLM